MNRDEKTEVCISLLKYICGVLILAVIVMGIFRLNSYINNKKEETVSDYNKLISCQKTVIKLVGDKKTYYCVNTQ